MKNLIETCDMCGYELEDPIELEEKESFELLGATVNLCRECADKLLYKLTGIKRNEGIM